MEKELTKELVRSWDIQCKKKPCSIKNWRELLESFQVEDSSKCQILKAEMSLVTQETVPKTVWLKYSKGENKQKSCYAETGGAG